MKISVLNPPESKEYFFDLHASICENPFANRPNENCCTPMSSCTNHVELESNGYKINQFEGIT